MNIGEHTLGTIYIVVFKSYCTEEWRHHCNALEEILFAIDFLMYVVYVKGH